MCVCVCMCVCLCVRGFDTLVHPAPAQVSGFPFYKLLPLPIYILSNQTVNNSALWKTINAGKMNRNISCVLPLLEYALNTYYFIKQSFAR